MQPTRFLIVLFFLGFLVDAPPAATPAAELHATGPAAICLAPATGQAAEAMAVADGPRAPFDCADGPVASESADANARKPRGCATYGSLCQATENSCCPGLRCAFDGYAYWCRY